MATHLLLALLLLVAITGSGATSDEQIHNILDAIIGAGDFNDWAKALSVGDSATFPITATLFLPEADMITNIVPFRPPPIFDPQIFSYHIVPQLLTFADLRRFPVSSRLPTLLPNKSIIVTNNSTLNYTINSIRITRPDLFISGPVAVHGIASMLDYNGFGDEAVVDSPESPVDQSPSSSPDDDQKESSEAPFFCTGFFIALSFDFAVFGFNGFLFV